MISVTKYFQFRTLQCSYFMHDSSVFFFLLVTIQVKVHYIPLLPRFNQSLFTVNSMCVFTKILLTNCLSHAECLTKYVLGGLFVGVSGEVKISYKVSESEKKTHRLQSCFVHGVKSITYICCISSSVIVIVRATSPISDFA